MQIMHFKVHSHLGDLMFDKEPNNVDANIDEKYRKD